MRRLSNPNVVALPIALIAAAWARLYGSSQPMLRQRAQWRARAVRRFSRFPIFLAAAFLPVASAPCWAQTNFGSVNIGASAESTVTLTLPGAATLGSISVVTQGATGLDFTNAGKGTCAAGASYSAGQTCTVEATFKPAYAGARFGAALLKDGSGVVIATGFLAGVGVGPQIAYGLNAPIVINPIVDGENLGKPSGVAVDGAGNLYIADYQNDRVMVVPADGGAATAIDPPVYGQYGEGLIDPAGVVVDGAGNLYITELEGNQVAEVPAGNGAPTAFDPTVNGKALDYPCGLAVDGAGNLYVANVDVGIVVEVPADGSSLIAINPTVNGKALDFPVTLALDSAGDLFIGDKFNNRIVEVPAGGGAPTAIDPTVDGVSLNQPYGVAVDAAGDLFIADAGNNRVVEIPASGGAPFAINTTAQGQGLDAPINIALDAAGDLFIADSNNNRVVEVQSSQPSPLSFAVTSVGSISSDSPQPVQVENIGNLPLTFPIPSTGNDPSISAGFTLDSSGASACPLVTPSSSAPGVLDAGASCLLPVSFKPASSGSKSGTLILTDNNLNSASPGYANQSILLEGGFPPVASISAASISFGYQQVGSTNSLDQVTLTNTGGAVMSIASISVTGANASSFQFQNTCGSSLPVAASCLIYGHFTPTVVGPLTAAIAIADNATGSPQTIPLTGTGVDPTTVTVTTSSSSITAAQPLTVTVAVGGGTTNSTATGSVTLTIGSYGSQPATLSNGSVTFSIPPGSLTVGTDSIVAFYTPDLPGSAIYTNLTGSSSVIVIAAPAPASATGAASAITANSATLTGTVNPNGTDTHYWFLYGTNNTLSGASQTPSVDLGSSTAAGPVTASISGLSASTTFYFQAVAESSAGTTVGVIESFTTTAPPNFSIAGTSITVSPGATSGNSAAITLTPLFGFTGAVNLSCAITPAAASDPPACSLQPASVTISGTASQTATLIVSTTAATALNKPSPLFWPSAGGAVAACILWFGIPGRRKLRTTLGMLALLLALAGGVFACGGSSGGVPSNPGTTAGTYTINVTGISGSTAATDQVTLTIQ